MEPTAMVARPTWRLNCGRSLGDSFARWLSKLPKCRRPVPLFRDLVDGTWNSLPPCVGGPLSDKLKGRFVGA